MRTTLGIADDVLVARCERAHRPVWGGSAGRVV